MKISIEDTISEIVVLIFLVVWYLTLVGFDSPLMRLCFLWISMTLLSIVYVYIDKKRKRDLKVLRIRFFCNCNPSLSSINVLYL